MEQAQAFITPSKPESYGIVTFLSTSARERIMGLLYKLHTELNGYIWTIPPHLLHATLCEIIQPKPYSEDKEQLFQAHADEYIETPAKIFKDTPPLFITFNRLEVSPQAIIVRAEDSTDFNTIRQKLTNQLILPAETRTPPDITHSTIARFTTSCNLDEVRRIVDKYEVMVQETITSFQLVHNLNPPRASYEVVSTYQLKA